MGGALGAELTGEIVMTRGSWSRRTSWWRETDSGLVARLHEFRRRV